MGIQLPLLAQRGLYRFDNAPQVREFVVLFDRLTVEWIMPFIAEQLGQQRALVPAFARALDAPVGATALAISLQVSSGDVINLWVGRINWTKQSAQQVGQASATSALDARVTDIDGVVTAAGSSVQALQACRRTRPHPSRSASWPQRLSAGCPALRSGSWACRIRPLRR